MVQARKWLVAGMVLALFGSRVLADDAMKGKGGKDGEMMPCCVDKKDCCKDKKGCCSAHEGSMGDKGDKRGEGRGPMGRMAEKLGLSEDQKTKLKALHEKQGATWKALAEQMRASIKALKEGVDNKAPDAQLAKLISAVEAARTKMRAQEDTSIQEMKKILTVPQQAKAALTAAHKARQKMQGGDWKKDRRGKGGKDKDKGGEDDDGDEEHEGHDHGTMKKD